MTYKTIYADPPWPEIGGGKIVRGAQHHYPVMKVEEIKALGDFVKGLADPGGCHLYLWTTNNYLHDAIHVMEARGFRYVTVITWMKDRMGLGQYFRGLTEHCLFGVRGALPYRTLPNGDRAQGRTGFISPRQEHSKKPITMRVMIETVSHPPYIELFARPPHPPNWEVWGNEAESDARESNLESFNLPGDDL